MDTKKVHLIFMDTKKRFDEVRSQISHKSFKNIIQFEFFSELETFINKPENIGEYIVVFLHIVAATLEGYRSGLKDDIKSVFPDLKIHLITRASSTIKPGEIDEVIYTYHQLKEKIQNDIIEPQSISGILVKKCDFGNEDTVKPSLKIDFTILTALPKDEFYVFKKHISGRKTNGAFLGKFINLEEHHYNKDVTLVSQKKMGMVDSAVKVSEIIKDINPEMIILTGVCGGRKEKNVKLYDIIIPEQIIDIITGKYENGKFTPYNYTEKVNEELIEYLKETVITEDFIKKEMYSLISNDPKYKRENEIIQNITIHHDTMACGPFVLKTNDFLENKSKEINDKIVGFEMESYGVIRAIELSRSNKYGLVIKSVMDYTDSKKVDIKTKDLIIEEDVDKIPYGENIKAMAAYMSYVCTRALLPHLEKFLNESRK